MQRHVLTYEQWLNESFFINDKKGRHNLKLFMSTKDPNWEVLWKNRELKFANNAGNMYGLGVYANLEMPEDSEIWYGEEYRKEMYGEHIYEMEIPSDTVFYFYYDYFKDSKLYEKAGKPTREKYIEAQLDYFKIPRPEKKEDIDMHTSDFIPAREEDRNGKIYYNEGKAAFKFYKYMSSIYPQREDGTLESPINGVAYKGQKDGRSIVIWSPYNLRLIRKKIEGMDWEILDDHVKTYTDEKDKQKDIEDTVYDGNMTKAKEEAYRNLMLYRGKNTPVGQFTNVVIHDDKTIDATFKSNLPNVDGGRHAYPVYHNSYIDRILIEGFEFGVMDAWIKFGSTESGNEIKLLDPSRSSEKYCPSSATGGVIFSNYTNGIKRKVEELNEMRMTTNNQLMLEKCKIDTDDFGKYSLVELNYCVIEDKYFDKYKKIASKHGNHNSISSSQEEELIEYVKENKTMSKSDKEEWAKKFNMKTETFEKVYSHLDSLKDARK